MVASQITDKIKRGLKFMDNDEEFPSPKSPKRERPAHKSFVFAKGF